MRRETKTIRLEVHARLESSAVNGPGRRAVIWLRGCSLGCSGCWNPATHKRSGGSTQTVGEILTWLGSVRSSIGIAGLTISGGEPLEQAPGLVELVQAVRESFPDLSIGLFSGYSETELDRGDYRCFPEQAAAKKRELWRRIRGTLDFAVLGRYNRVAASLDPLVTSRNQQLRLYSRRYSPADFAPQLVEVTIEPRGRAQVTGFPVSGSVA